jgi:hypothetical protein
MNSGMAGIAEQNQVGRIRPPVVQPIVTVVALSPYRWDSAARASTTTEHACGQDLIVTEHTLATTEKQGHPCLVEDGRDNFRVTEILQDGRRRD